MATRARRSKPSPVRSLSLRPFLITFAILGTGDENGLWLILILFPLIPLATIQLGKLLPAKNPRTPGPREIRFPYRPPVVYLRAFEREAETFARENWRWDRFRSNFVRSALHRRPWLRYTFEEFISAEVNARIGPFIALGNPLDFVPPEHSAARAYAPDTEWNTYFDDLASRAACLVATHIASDNVVWELSRIRTLGLTPKFYLFTRPRPMWKASHDWLPAADVLSRSGYSNWESDPGPGCVLGFESEGRMIVLSRNASTPAELVTALLRK